MKKILLLLAAVFLLNFAVREGGNPARMSASLGEALRGAVDSGRKVQDAVAETALQQEGSEQALAAQPDETSVPTFFPQARIVARVSDPPDAEGRRRVIETIETTGMRQPFVRIERVLSTGRGGRTQLEEEVAMVANQLLLERPEALAEEGFFDALKRAGAVEVKAVGSGRAYLATFAAEPTDPRALDGHLARVREVAGAEINVEPNYIRQLF